MGLRRDSGQNPENLLMRNHYSPASPQQQPQRSSFHSHNIVALIKSILTIFIIFIITLALYSAFTYPLPKLTYQRLNTLSSTYNLTINSPSIPEPTNLSHIVFGLSGSASTWPYRRHYCELWWDNSTRGFVWLDEEYLSSSSSASSFNSPPIRISTPSPTLKNITLQAADRIARIVKESYDDLGMDGKGETRWFVMGDDDTVFFKENLVTVLSRYDHRRMVYVGAPSESVEQNVLHWYGTGFGGGGFAVSYALARELSGVIDGCVERYLSFYGSDEKVAACVGELGVPLSRELGFHQIDIREDPYGLLAAHPLTPLVSLHHLDQVNPLFPNHTHLDSLSILISAYKLDPTRLLQQSICYDRRRRWSVSVSWGYTLQIYTSIVSARELSKPLQTFKTWRTSSDGPFVFSTRDFPPPDPCDLPVVYFMDRVEEIGSGKIRTRYKVGESGSRCNESDYKSVMMGIKRITVVASIMNAKEWILAPRRECCEIKESHSTGVKKKSLNIIIRSCKAGETITP